MRSLQKLHTPEEVRTLIRKHCPPPVTGVVPIHRLRGRKLAEALVAPYAHPAFDNSSVDGYALGSSDTDSFELIGVSRAGDPFMKALSPGKAVRIFTGCMVPEGTYAIVAQEWAEKLDNRVRVLKMPAAGANIRTAGCQFQPGNIVLPAGTSIRPSAFGLLHGLGIKDARIFLQPSVQVVITGDEIVPAHQKPVPGKIRDENGPALMAAFEQENIHPCLSYAKDQEEQMTQILRSCLGYRLTIVTGGASVGDYDLVPGTLEKIGITKLFHGVGQKPGRPMWAGVHANGLVLALPGNPAAVVLAWHLYILPILNYWNGEELVFPEENCLKARLKQPVRGENERVIYIRGLHNGDLVEVLEGQESHMLGSFALANCLIRVPAGTAEIPAGEFVDIIPL